MANTFERFGPPPKPRKGMDYYWAAADSAHPQSVYEFLRLGWRMPLHKEAKELGFEPNQFKVSIDGGIQDALNVLMERPDEDTRKAADEKIAKANQLRNDMEREQKAALETEVEAGGPGRAERRPKNRVTEEEDEDGD